MKTGGYEVNVIFKEQKRKFDKYFIWYLGVQQPSRY